MNKTITITIKSPEGFVFTGDMVTTMFTDSYYHYTIKLPIKPEEHVHAKVMTLYEKDSKITKEPWKLYQGCSDKTSNSWVNLGCKPFWHPDSNYRRHPHADTILEWEQASPEKKSRLECKDYKTGEWLLVNSIEPSWTLDHYRFAPEPLPYSDFKIDDLVLVWPNSTHGCTFKYKRYFAGVTSAGKPLTWKAGATSITADGDKTYWDNCTKLT